MGLLNSLFGQKPVQAQTSMQPQSQGLLGNLSDPLVALPLAGALMQPGGFGQNLGQGFAMAGQGLEYRKKQQKEELQQNMTAKYLEAQGADPALVEMAKSGAGAQALQAWQQTREKPLDELRLKTAQLQYEKLKSGDEDEFYGTPVYGTDATGNTVIGQYSKSGKFKTLETPDGFKPSSGVEKIDMGTQWGLYDKRTGNMIGTQPKDVAGEASQKVKGTAQGEAQVALPSVIANAEQSLKIIDDLQTDPNRQFATGKSSSFNILPGTGGYDYKQKVNQLKGKAFLEAYSQLKGTGAISEIEGTKAEQAVARLDVAQTEEGFNQALNDLKEVISNGIQRAKAKAAAGGGAVQPAAPAAPQATSSGVTWRVVP